MKSAYAELIGEFFARGGQVTKLPDGIGLGEPVKVKTLVGGARDNQAQCRAIGRQVRQALADAGCALTLLGLEDATGISFERLRGPMKVLERDRMVRVTRGENGRTRLFHLCETGMGETSGGPASESASEACASVALTSDARPGRRAA